MDQSNSTTTQTTTAAPAQPDMAAAIASVAGALERVNARLESLEKAKPVTVTQTTDQAIASAEAIARDRTEKAGIGTEEHARIVKQLEEKLAKAEADKQAELEKLRSTVDLRRSPFSLGEMTKAIEESAGVTKDATKAFWHNAVTKHATSQWKLFEGLTPIDVLIRGAMGVGEQVYNLDGHRHVVRSLSPFTAGSSDETLREAQEASDLVLVWKLWKQAKGAYVGDIRTECPFYPRLQKALAVLSKAMTTTTITNWVPTGFSARVYERFELERNLLRFIDVYQMTQNPENVPVRGSYLTAYVLSQTATDPESATGITTTDLNDLQVQFQLFSIAIRAAFSVEAEEDSLPALVPELISDFARSWNYTLENMILNSDSVAPHYDVDTSGATNPLTTWQGLRPAALRNTYTTDLSGSNHTVEKIVSSLTAAMGKYGAKPSDCVWVAGAKERALLKTLKTSGGHPVIIGAAAPGMPSAVTGRGEIPVEMVDGSPLVVVEAAREDLNASGFYDGTTTNLGTLLKYNRLGWRLGFKNQAGEVLTQRHPKTFQTEIASLHRYEFEDMFAIASNRTVQLGIGVSYA